MSEENIISIKKVQKTYGSGLCALKDIDLEIKKGEIFALLGPNGAGKTTLINIICGILNSSGGKVTVLGHDIHKEYRKTRSAIGLVPQELSTDMFEKVWDTVKFSRSLYGKSRNDAHLEKVLKDLTLWEKKDNKIMTLSGGMKRRVMMAKALSHEPQVLFLDEPTAGVDVELRREMWQMVRGLKESGVTIILTTHYIAEAEEMADRVGVINKGEIILVDEKKELIKKLGKKVLTIKLKTPMPDLSSELSRLNLSLSEDKKALTFHYDSKAADPGIIGLIKKLEERGIEMTDIETKESSLEEIFVQLIGKQK